MEAQLNMIAILRICAFKDPSVSECSAPASALARIKQRNRHLLLNTCLCQAAGSSPVAAYVGACYDTRSQRWRENRSKSLAREVEEASYAR
jgi:hypothetical protein